MTPSPLIDFVQRWPVWYWALIVFTIYSAINAQLEVRRVAPAYAKAKSEAADDHRRGMIAGSYARIATIPYVWLAAAIGLTIGWQWVRIAFAVVLVLGRALKGFKGFATGFAEGRKASYLASAPEYVRGRAAPKALDYAASFIFALVSSLLPALASLYAFVTLR